MILYQILMNLYLILFIWIFKIGFKEVLDYLNNEIRNLTILNLFEGEYWMRNDQKIKNVYWNETTVFKMKSKIYGWSRHNYDF